MNCPRTYHLEESNARIQVDNSDRRKLWERQYQCIDKFDTSDHFATVFIIYVEHWLLHLWMSIMLYKLAIACMEAYENKLPQGFYNKISSYGVTMVHPWKGLTWEQSELLTDIEVVFNRTLSIIGSEEFDLHHLFSHELALSMFLDDGSIISTSSK